MRPLPLTLLGLVSLAPACTPEVAAEARAAARFEAFQDALFAGDHRALRDLVCRDARPAIAALCQADRRGQHRLTVTGVHRDRHEYRVQVRDPNADPANTSFYVLTREDGVLRVDLLATYAYHRPADRGGSRQLQFTPGRLDPEQVRRAQTALPPTSPR